MTPGEIKQALRERNLTMAGIGRRLRPRVTPKSVQRVVDQIPGSSSARIRRAVAKAIGREESDVFGNAA
jgi:hypothetical protein